MSDYLSVQPEFLDVLANAHDSASACVGYATETVTGIDEEVATTHGSYTSTFNNSLATFVTLRNAAGKGLQTLATQVAGNLRIAAASYVETDSSSAELVGKTDFSG